MGTHPEADFSLFLRARDGDQQALERLWKFYEAYVKTTARSFYRKEYGAEFLEDLFAESRYRFCKAVQYFKPDNPKGVPFSRYCRTIVARALLDMRLAAQKDLDNCAKTDLLDLDELREIACNQPEFGDSDSPADALGALLTELSTSDRAYALKLCTGLGWLASAKQVGITRKEAIEALERLREAARGVGLAIDEHVPSDCPDRPCLDHADLS